jgi:TRAP-type C4-dicarboxylate transport system permease small subunit
MKLKKKVLIFLAVLTLPYMCAVALLVPYARTHPGKHPMWIPLVMLGFLITTCVVGGIYLSRFGRRNVATEGLDERTQRQATAAKGLKIGIIVFCLIFLNGIRLVVQHTVPWQYAVPGLTVDFFFVFICWISLNRLRKSQAQNTDHTP